jgi:iron complex transport system substrate-binding protein
MRRASLLAILPLAIAVAAASICAASAPPARIVSLAPSVTETLFALGAGDSVVGVSSYCEWPPAATRLPKVGTFLTPNVEAIAALRPDLIVGVSLSSHRREFRALGAMGYPILTVNDDSIQAIEQGIATIGARTRNQDAARHLLEQIRSQIQDVRERLGATRPRRVVMIVGHEPIVAAGRGTYLDDLIHLAGGDNIAEKSAESWPQLSIEYIIAMRPEIILDGSMGTEASAPAAFWSRYPEIPAVRDHRICGYPQDPVLHPGPRVGQSLKMLARMIHPEAFASSHAAPSRPAESLQAGSQ